MILADTSVWIDHLGKGDMRLAELLEEGKIILHPHVIGEIALGSLRQRELVIERLQMLPQAVVADDAEVLAFIGLHRLHGLGIGYVDAHLLASAMLTRDARLWTRDRRLREAAIAIDVAYRVAH